MIGDVGEMIGDVGEMIGNAGEMIGDAHLTLTFKRRDEPRSSRL